MRRGEDGAVQLDCGRLGGVSERLVVTYERDGKVTGRSALPAQTADDALLEARVLEARNTIFSQELWHELTREARTLAAYDVKPDGSRLSCTIDETSKVTVELVPLDSQAASDESLPDANIAETISLALHILLSYAHRNNELMRTRPMPPHISRSRGQQTCNLLRPIIARLMHLRNVEACTEQVGGLVRAFQCAGFPARFTLQTVQVSTAHSDTSSRGPNQPSASQVLVRNFLQPTDFTITINLLPDVSFSVRGRTFLFPVTATYYYIIVPSSSPLASACPPYKDGYPDLKALADYLFTATARILTNHLLARIKQSHPTSKWIKTLQGNAIESLDKEGLSVGFTIKEIDSVPSLQVTLGSPENGNISESTHTWPADSITKSASAESVVDQAVMNTLV